MCVRRLAMWLQQLSDTDICGGLTAVEIHQVVPTNRSPVLPQAVCPWLLLAVLLLAGPQGIGTYLQDRTKP